MYSFRLGAAFSGANETYLRGITEISRVTTGGRSYLLTNSGPGGGVMALQLTGASSGHGLRLADQMALAKSYRSGPDAGLEMVSIDGQLRVTTMGPTVSSVSATALSSTGALDGNLTLRGLPANRADLCFVEHSSGLLCFAVSTNSADITAYRATGTGKFSAFSRFTLPQGDIAGADDLRLELSTTTGGAQVLLAATASGNAVVALKIWSDGHLSETGRLSAESGLGIAAPQAMEVLHAWGKSWVLVGGGNSSTVTLAELRADGSLLAQDHVVDSLLTRFQGATDLAATSVAGRPVIVVGGGDDGVTALTILPNGRLAALAVQTTTATLPLNDISAVELATRGGVVDIFAGSESEASLARVALDLSHWSSPRLGSSGADTLNGGSSDDLIWGKDGADVISGGAGRDLLMDGAGRDTMRGGSGADSFALSDDGEIDVIADFDLREDRLDLSAWGEIYSSAALDVQRQSDGSAWIRYGDERLHIIGRDGQVITEAGIARVLDLGLMHLPTGSVTDIYDRALVQAKIPTGGTFAIAVLEDNMGDGRADGTSGRDSLTGNADDNELRGYDGHDTLDGGAGADLMIGGAGNDLYRVSESGDRIVEKAGGGYDRVETAISYHLVAQIEEARLLGTANLSLSGNSGNNVLRGNSGANRLNGNDGNDTLISYGGRDTLRGGAGNDHYILSSGAEQVIETTGEGRDKVSVSVSYSLNGYVEDLTLTGHGNLTGRGNGASNVLTGNDGANRLLGLAGHDTLSGGGGDDTLEGGAGNDVYDLSGGMAQIVELRGGGSDRVILSTDGKLTDFENIESLELAGRADLTATGTLTSNQLIGNDGNNRLNGLWGNDRLDGGDGDDIMDGGRGADVMIGGAGDDIYIVDDKGDQVREAANGGTRDRVLALISYQLTAGVEILQVGPQERIDGTGQDEENWLLGSSGRNILSGMGGNDWLYGGPGDDTLRGGSGNDRMTGGQGRDEMAGGTGDDVFYVDAKNETVIELSNQGRDRVFSTASFNLSDHVEELVLVGPVSLTGHGNAGNNLIIANRGGCALHGHDGNDNLRGGMSADTIYGGAGNDRLIASRGDDLLYGNDGDDWIIAGWGNDLIYGGAGNEWSYGGDHDDRMYGETGHDTLMGGRGVDRIYGASGHDWLDGGSENDRLEGGSGDDILIGGTGADTILGEAGDDRLFSDHSGDYLFGGDGDDRYIVRVAMPHIIEGSGGGQDLMVSLLSNATLPNQVEEGLLGGNENRNMTGNGLDNRITGNGANNIIHGGSGDDALLARSGDDRLYGGSGNDFLRGEAGTDKLEGGSGNDQLNGGYGADVLTGGSGSDVFEFFLVDLTGGADRITDFNHNADQISLIYFGAEFSGTLAEDSFVAGTKALDDNDHILYDRASGRVWFDADGHGDGHAQLLARLNSGTFLDHSDFQFF